MNTHSEDFFLFLGAADSESATSRLRAEGTSYVKKLLESNPENWRRIIELVQSPKMRGALVALKAGNYLKLVNPRYEELGRQLLDAIAAKPHIIFVHEAVYFADNEREADELEQPVADEEANDPFGYDLSEDYFVKVPEEVRVAVNLLLSDRDLNVLPYRTNVERSVLAASFLDDHERHLLFRIYIPAGRLYAREADTLLGLFRDWLNKTGRNAVRQDGYQTQSGQVYEFFGNQEQAPGSLTRQFSDFSDFLDACTDYPDMAARQLTEMGQDPLAASQTVSRYAKASRRLQLDLRHAREERILTLRHELEAELLETPDRQTDILPVLAALIPPLQRSSQILAPPPTLAQATEGAGTRIDITINQQLIGQVAGHAIQSLQGSIHLGPEPRELLDLISHFGGPRAAELEGAVHELEDDDARRPDRVAARQKLRRFLGSLGAEASKMALSTLHKYLEHRIGLP